MRWADEMGCHEEGRPDGLERKVDKPAFSGQISASYSKRYGIEAEHQGKLQSCHGYDVVVFVKGDGVAVCKSRQKNG